jgi:hypothetical protein
LALSIIPENISAATTVSTVKASSIKYIDDGGSSFKWTKVKGVSGYQVEIIDGELYEYDDIIKIYSRKTTSKNKITIPCPYTDTTYYIRVRIRAFKKNKDGSKKYSKWVVSTRDWITQLKSAL